MRWGRTPREAAGRAGEQPRAAEADLAEGAHTPRDGRTLGLQGATGRAGEQPRAAEVGLAEGAHSPQGEPTLGGTALARTPVAAERGTVGGHRGRADRSRSPGRTAPEGRCSTAVGHRARTAALAAAALVAQVVPALVGPAQVGRRPRTAALAAAALVPLVGPALVGPAALAAAALVAQVGPALVGPAVAEAAVARAVVALAQVRPAQVEVEAEVALVVAQVPQVAPADPLRHQVPQVAPADPLRHCRVVLVPFLLFVSQKIETKPNQK